MLVKKSGFLGVKEGRYVVNVCTIGGVKEKFAETCYGPKSDFFHLKGRLPFVVLMFSLVENLRRTIQLYD